jgi:hypothetical protein
VSTGDHVDLLSALVTWAREREFTAIFVSSRPSPYRVYGDGAEFALAQAGARVVARDVTHATSLAGDEDALRARIRGSSRRGARKAERLGTVIRHGGPSDLAAYHALLAEDRARLGATPTHSAAELADLWERRPDDAHLLLAENDGELVGGSMLFRATPRVALGFYLARAESPAAERCTNLLCEAALRSTHESGYEWLDWGTSSIGGEFNRGLSEFKEGFGGVPFVRETWRLDLD